MKRYIRSSRQYLDLSSRDGATGNYRKAKNFESLLHMNGFTILGYREYNDHFAYKIEKEGVVMEITYFKNANPKGTFAQIDELWNNRKNQRI